MTKSLLTLTPLFVIFLFSTFSTFGQDTNQIEAKILSGKKELVLSVVDVEGFAGQDDMTVGYKSRYYANIKWLKQNWHKFSKSVAVEKSYSIKLNAETYQALSSSEKSKLKELFKTCYTKTFDPIGLAKSQLSAIKYNPKYDKEQFYQKQQLTEKDIESYVQNKRTVVLVLNTEIAAQISTILKR